MRRIGGLLAVIAAVALSGCAAKYELVPVAETSVARSTMIVAPSFAWNRVPRGPSDVRGEENWTANGPSLDLITFLGGIEDGRPIVKQRSRDQQQVPTFRANMTPQDLTSMLESFYRIRGQVSQFETNSVRPVTFVGVPGLRYEFEYVAGSGLRRQGVAVMAVLQDKLYLISLDAARSHYFQTALPEFDRLVETARLARSS